MENMIAMVQYLETEYNLKFEGSWESEEDLESFIEEHFDKFDSVIQPNK